MENIVLGVILGIERDLESFFSLNICSVGVEWKMIDEKELELRLKSITYSDDLDGQVCRSDAVLELIRELLREQMDEETLKKLRQEFAILVNRCGCSRASLHITKEEAKEMSVREVEMKPHTPYCTPKKCFPTLYSLLYPKGGFRVVSYMVENLKKRVENR